MDEPGQLPPAAASPEQRPEHRQVPVAEASEPERVTARFAALFIFGVVMFSPLPLAIFDSAGTTVLGIPLLYFYLFTSWALLIALTAWLSQRIAGPAAAPTPPTNGD